VSETLWYVGSIVFVALGIGLSIGLHEVGHLWPAKAFGVKVPTYAIGFGPTLFKFQRGETTYAIKLIPLGGYITMIGMYPPAKVASAKASAESASTKLGFFADMILSARNAHAEHITPADKNRMFYQLPVWKRMIIMFGGPFMNLVLGTLLMIAALVGIGSQQQSNAIAEVSSCVIVNPVEQTECASGDPVSPAKAAGLQAGDRIESVNGVKFENWNTISQQLTVGSSANLQVLRNQKYLEISVIPVSALRASTDANGRVVVDKGGQPVLTERPVLGIVFDVERKPETVGAALAKSAWGVGQVGQMILTLPQQLTDVAVSTFTGQERNPNGAVSVVGIAQISGTIGSSESIDLLDKFATGLLILASLNFALFGFNMLPLLPLDGGHLAGGIYEWLKRGVFRLLRRPAPGPADTALLMPITWVVFIALMAMSALLIIADLVNPISI
jgi:membrane-associated protease RseP (regulator of RpoE activity)